jgi:hypothetical protein
MTLKLGSVRTPQWILDQLAEQGINAPELVAFDIDPVKQPGKVGLLIITARSDEGTVRGLEYNPEWHKKPQEHLDGIPERYRVPETRLSTNPNTQLTF